MFDLIRHIKFQNYTDAFSTKPERCKRDLVSPWTSVVCAIPENDRIFIFFYMDHLYFFRIFPYAWNDIYERMLVKAL